MSQNGVTHDQDVHFQIWWFTNIIVDGVATDSATFLWGLEMLHDEYCLTWREIGSLSFLERVPHTTLSDMYRKQYVSKKWREYLHVRPDYTPRLAINKVDIVSALRTLTRKGNLEHDYLIRLAMSLFVYLKIHYPGDMEQYDYNTIKEIADSV